jgi:ankyrin repeat protein
MVARSLRHQNLLSHLIIIKMKTQKNNPVSTVSIRITFAAMLMASLMLISCQDKKAGSEATAETKVTPQVDIHTAVVTDNLEALKQHIAAGTNLNEKDPYGGSSPLISASLFGKPEMAKLLIDAGADINFQNNDGATALHTSAFFCRPEIVKMLLDKGADKTIKNKFGATAYESVAGPFADVKSVYDMMGKMLAPMGLNLDYPYIEKTRPEIATMLK